MSLRQPLHALLLLNDASGAAVGKESQGLLEHLRTVFSDAGWSTKAELVAPDRLDQAFGEVAQHQDCDVVIAAGGDGTVLAAANALIGSDIALGIIPLGTFNQTARELGLPTDPWQAALSLTRAAPERMDCARVNGRLFLSTCLIGLPPRVTRGRQSLRGKPLDQRLAGYFQLLSRASTSSEKMTLSIDVGGSAQPMEALSVAISNNPFSESGLFLKRSTLKGGLLGVYISTHDTGAGMFAAFLGASLGSSGWDPEFERLTAKRLVINAPAETLLVSIDGEIAELETPLRFEILPQALCVLKPDEFQPKC